MYVEEARQAGRVSKVSLKKKNRRNIVGVLFSKTSREEASHTMTWGSLESVPIEPNIS